MNPENEAKSDTALHLCCLTHDSDLKTQTDQPWMYCTHSRHLRYINLDANKENVPPADSMLPPPRGVVLHPWEEAERTNEENQTIVTTAMEQDQETWVLEAGIGDIDPSLSPPLDPYIDEEEDRAPDTTLSIDPYDQDEDVEMEHDLLSNQSNSPQNEIEEMKDHPDDLSISSTSSHSGEECGRPRKKRKLENSP